MDRRDFLKKVAQLVGTSAAGISLTKLQIATIATGLSGAVGCARNPVGDDPLSKNGNPSLAPCSDLYTCQNQVYNCAGLGFLCVFVEFMCEAPLKFMCDANKFTCSAKFDCDEAGEFECAVDFSILHQGSVTVG